MTWKRGALGAGIAAGGVAAVYRLWLARSGAADPKQVGYPPLASPKQLDEGIWIVDDTMVASGLSLPVRMTVLRLGNGDLVLHSPTAFTPRLAGALRALGPVRHLVAPTTAHWTNLADWQRAFPQAVTWAVPGLRERLQVRLSSVLIDRDLGEEAPSEWADALDQGLIRGGGGFCESYFFHKSSRTLILCDTIQNLEPHKLPPVTRLAFQAAGGTRGTTAHHVRKALKLGGERARTAIGRVTSLQPERVIFAHGAIFETNAAARLQQAFAWMTRP